MKSIHKIGLMAAMIGAMAENGNNEQVFRDKPEPAELWKRKICKSCKSFDYKYSICKVGKRTKPTSKACFQWKSKNK